jgi:hypothetical protein
MAPRAPRGAPEPAVISQKIKAAFGKLTTAAHQPALPPDYLDSVVRDLSLVGPRPRKVISRRKMLRTLATMKKRAEVLNGDLAAMVALPIDWRVAIGLTAELNLPQLAPAIGGAPSKTLASRAARIAARHYWLWTGTRPHVRRPYADSTAPAGGPFIGLLTDIYAALGIDADVASQARDAIKAMKKTLPKITE